MLRKMFQNWWLIWKTGCGWTTVVLCQTFVFHFPLFSSYSVNVSCRRILYILSSYPRHKGVFRICSKQNCWVEYFRFLIQKRNYTFMKFESGLENFTTAMKFCLCWTTCVLLDMLEKSAKNASFWGRQFV